MRQTTRDRLLFLVIIIIFAGMPLTIYGYNTYRIDRLKPAHGRFFILSGSAEEGWSVGPVSAWQRLLDQITHRPATPAVIEVKKGETVVLQLTSSDVVHGFSMKGYGIFINDGIQPGKPVIVKFVADHVGNFDFSCNAICGKYHEKMKGILRVNA
jgi:heme/copper-type cytochrome/quinol oxidase subunit 2